MSASGVKFGKTEAGAVWLDAELTSPYQFYQFWLRTTDDDVVRYLKYFTWLDQPEIAELESALESAPQERAAHRRLARELTRMVHGETALALAEKSSEVLFGGSMEDISADALLDIFDDVPSTEMTPADFDGGLGLVDLVVRTGLAPSKGQARRLIKDGGAYVNNVRATDEHAKVTVDDFEDGRVLVLRKGRKAYHVVQLPGGRA
jgi:tyrosyl-tRNA synthetase